MTAAKKFLAFDLGAESGRGILGLFDGNQLRLEVVHRFPNGGVATLDTMHWDVLRLYGEMLQTLRLCAGQHGPVDGIGVDTWGVDFALLGRGNTLLGNPRHYRDPHTEGIMELAFQKVSRADIYRQTGLQFMRFNTLFQLIALQRDRSPLLDLAETMLLIPDLFHFFFTGIKANEYTNASTTQMIDPTTRNWAYALVQAFGLSPRLLGTVVQPGTILGPLRSAIAVDTGINPAPVIAPATHDTGSAVAAVPASSSTGWAFISSGTWSLMGVEIAKPLLTDAALSYNFTNEGGVAGTIRLLKNIMGLWLVQECRRAWEKQGKSFSYDELTRLAEAALPFVSIVDPDDGNFILPPNMPAALADFCRKTGQPAPQEPAAVIRCCLESLACRYRWVLERLEELTGQKLDVIHIVGGGSQNALLCQLAADCCNRTVVAGPVEATAIGNLLMQAIGVGVLGSLTEAREVVRRSFPVVTYTPHQPERWSEPYARFLKLLGK
jgi:rhamnulokinase